MFLFVFFVVFSKKRSLAYLNPFLTAQRSGLHFLVSFARARARGRETGRQFIFEPCLSTTSRRRTRRLARCVFLVALFRGYDLAKSRSVFPDRSRCASRPRISRVVSEPRCARRVIAKGEEGCLARWCANGLGASRIAARAV